MPEKAEHGTTAFGQKKDNAGMRYNAHARIAIALPLLPVRRITDGTRDRTGFRTHSGTGKLHQPERDTSSRNKNAADANRVDGQITRVSGRSFHAGLHSKEVGFPIMLGFRFHAKTNHEGNPGRCLLKLKATGSCTLAHIASTSPASSESTLLSLFSMTRGRIAPNAAIPTATTSAIATKASSRLLMKSATNWRRQRRGSLDTLTGRPFDIGAKPMRNTRHPSRRCRTTQKTGLVSGHPHLIGKIAANAIERRIKRTKRRTMPAKKRSQYE